MNVHGETKPACLECDVVKNKILERLVVSSRRLAAANITRIDAAGGDRVRFFKIELTEVSSFKIYRDFPLTPFCFERCGHRLFEVSIERPRPKLPSPTRPTAPQPTVLPR